MKELEECLRLSREIEKINCRIRELKAVVLSPKNQIITGMPRGGNTENVVDRYLIRIERLESRKKELANNQVEYWQVVTDNTPKLNEQNKRLLFLRFMLGYTWKKCAVTLNAEYGNWNINRVFRTYRYILNTECEKYT